VNLLALWIALGVFLFSLVVFGIIVRRKRSWYKVYLTNNDIRLMSRGWDERWRSNDKYPRFRDDDGNEVTFPESGHWIMFWERIPDWAVERVRKELAMREEEAKRERKELEI